MQRVVFDCRLVAVHDLERWHERLGNWARRWRTEIVAEPERVVVDTDAKQAQEQLVELISEVLKRAEMEGSVLAIGIAAGEASPLRLADDRFACSARAMQDARALADAARPGQVLVSGSARPALNGAWTFGRRRVLDVTGGIAAQELFWRDEDAAALSSTQRLRGIVTTIEADRSAVIAGDDGTAYFAAAGQQLADANRPGIVVWFVRRAGAGGDRAQAVAMAPVGALLRGSIERQGEQTLLRSNTSHGHWMTFLAREGDLMAESAYVGDRCRFRVTDGVGGPGAREIERDVDVPRPTVVNRILVACMAELAKEGAGGAASAVRRSTKTIATDNHPFAEERRLWLALTHAGGAWVLPALDLLADGGGPPAHAAAREAVALRDRAGARRLVVALGELLQQDVVSTAGRDLRPLLRAVRLAANHATLITDAPRPEEVDHVASAAILVGEAMAQAMLCGVIEAVPSEAKHLARRLAGDSSVDSSREPAEGSPGDHEPSTARAPATDGAEPDEPTNEAAAEVVGTLLRYARDHVIPGLDYDDPYRNAIPVALFARSISLVEAAVLLGERGHGREIVMLNRPLFEYMVDAYWAAKNPERAERRFVEHARHSQDLRRRFLAQNPELFPTSAPTDLLDPDELRRLERVFGRHGEKSWTGVNLRRRVSEIAPMFDNEANMLRLSYEINHRLANAELHTTSWSLARSLRRVQLEDGSERLQVRIEPEAELVATGLQQTWWVFGQLLGLMHRQVGLDLEPLWAVSSAGAQELGFVTPGR